METRSSYVLVGAVVLALTVALFAFILWIARYSGEETKNYDILFRSAVTGLSVGSAVQFQGVPVGTVKTIALVPDQPELVRVRIEVGGDVPILEGTTAAIEAIGFTGVAQVQLQGAMRGEKPIVDNGPFGAPIIPTRPGAFGQLLANAPELVNRVSELVQHLNEILNPKNQESIAGILANTEKFTGSLADRGPEIAATLAEAKTSLQAAARAADAITKLAGTTDNAVETDVRPLIAELRVAVGNANRTLAKVDKVLDAAQPGIAGISDGVVPDASATLIQIQGLTAQLGAIAAKLDQDPAAALLGGRTLPDYKPEAAPAK